jgi:predicted lysophospholipase L1 biosynthesis ABC-type transport system permease subunit
MGEGPGKEAERIAERAIEAVQTAREEKRPLAPDERAKVRQMQRHPEARREVERTRRGMTVVLLGALLLLVVAVVLLAVHFLG